MTEPSYHQLVFVPLLRNRAFHQGFGMSIEYRLLECIDFALDFRRLELAFTFARIILVGDHLEPLFDLVRAHAIDRIDQVEQDMPSTLTYRVLGMGYTPC